MGVSFHLFCRMPLKYIGSAKYCRSATSFGFEATFGDYHWHSLQGAIKIPIADGKLALRVAGEVVQRDGYQRDIGVGAAACPARGYEMVTNHSRGQS